MSEVTVMIQIEINLADFYLNKILLYPYNKKIQKVNIALAEAERKVLTILK